MLRSPITDYLVKAAHCLPVLLKPWQRFLLPGILGCLSLSATATQNGTVKPLTTNTTGSSTPPVSAVKTSTPLPSILTLPTSSNTLVPEYVVIRPSEEITFSSEISASVMKENIKEGSHFAMGDILLVLDCRVQQADLEKAKAQQQLSNVAITSAKKLKSYNSISNFEYAQAIAQLESANADVNKLTAVVEKCTIKAPFSGSVARLMIHSGETVKPGDPLMKIVSTQDLDFQMQIPSDWLKWLHIGSNFFVHVNEINKTVPITIVRIDPEIDSVSQTVRIIGKTSEMTPNLLPGMSGQAKFVR